MIYLVHSLRWEHVDPASRPFDPAPVRAIAERIVGPVARELPSKRDRACEHPRQTQCEVDLDLSLMAHYGAWVAGWNWAASEPGGGGPVRAWCCARDSVLREGEPIEATIDRVDRAVREWRGFLEELSRLQSILLTETAHMAREDAIERAATRYLPYVIACTGADDAWYGTFRLVLKWHLEALGDDDARIERTIRDITSGRFESWVEPPAEVAKEVCAELGLQLAEVLATSQSPPDALAEWLAARGRVTWERERRHSPGVVVIDGHRAFIDTYDRARSEPRARRMHKALTFLREASAKPLSWSLLCDAERLALGNKDVGFREGEAFAKGGRERYGLTKDTRATFERCLSEANDSSLSPLARAARVYFDVCFFHPYNDGNGRAARLALDYVLTRAGLALHVAEPLFLLQLHANDPNAAWGFAYLLDKLAGRRGP